MGLARVLLCGRVESVNADPGAREVAFGVTNRYVTNNEAKETYTRLTLIVPEKVSGAPFVPGAELLIEGTLVQRADPAAGPRAVRHLILVEKAQGLDADGKSHFATCPQAAEHRRAR